MFVGPIGKQKWPPWPPIQTEWNSMQFTGIKIQAGVIRADRRTKHDRLGL